MFGASRWHKASTRCYRLCLPHVAVTPSTFQATEKIKRFLKDLFKDRQAVAECGWCIGAILKLLQVSDITDVQLLGLRVSLKAAEMPKTRIPHSSEVFSIWKEEASLKQGCNRQAACEVCLRCEWEIHPQTEEASAVCFVCGEWRRTAGASREEMSPHFGRLPNNLNITDNKKGLLKFVKHFQSLHRYTFYTRAAGRRQRQVEEVWVSDERFIPQNVPAVQIYEDEFSLQEAEQPKAFILFTCKPKQSEGAVKPWAEWDVEWRQMMMMMMMVMCTVYGRVCEAILGAVPQQVSKLSHF